MNMLASPLAMSCSISGSALVAKRARRLLEQDVVIRTRHADGEPAHDLEVDVGRDLKPQLVDVKVGGRVLVVDKYP